MIHDLTESEAKSILLCFFLDIERLDSEGYSREQFVDDTTKQYHEILELYTEKMNDDFSDHTSHVHIMFGDSSAGGLKIALKQMGLHLQHHIMILRDIYAVGPMQHLDTPEGREHRCEWLRDRVHAHDGDDDFMYDEDFFNKTIAQIERIPEHVAITVWSGNNAQEQVGLRYALYLFRNKSNPIYMINAGMDSHTLFDTPEFTIDYRHTGEISPEKLGSIMKHNEGKASLSKTEIEKFEQEWLSISGNSSVLRIWEHRGIVHVSEDYYDQYMTDTVSKFHRERGNMEFVKSARVIGEVIGNLEQFITDSFFEYRLRQLIYNGVLEIKGIPKAMRYYSVRLRE